jgi:hypothetical protein
VAKRTTASAKTIRPIRAFQWDLARQVERLDVLLALLPKYSEWGYEELYLHLEDAVEYPSFPSIARADAYHYRDLERLVGAASKVGIRVVPIVNLLGHTQYLIKTPELRDLNELRAEDGSPLERGQICPLHSRTMDVAAALMDDMKPFCTAGKLHVGLDESFHLGRCPRCRAEIAEHGLAYHFAHYAGKLRDLVVERGLRMGLWADMLYFIPEAIEQLPSDVIAYDWYYYPFERHPRIELFNFKEVDLAQPLKAREIEYWGCPMNGAFRFEPLPIFKDRLANLRAWWRRCEKVGAGGFLVTSWEAYRLAMPLTTVVDAGAASLWKNEKAVSDEQWLVTGFERVFSLRKSTAVASARLALALDRYSFAGYAAWELHTDWTVRAGLSSRKALEKSTRALRALINAANRSTIPEALRASLILRTYWEERALFVQTMADGVFELRRRLGSKKKNKMMQKLAKLIQAFAPRWREAQRAARQMWKATRDPKHRGQNEEILADDFRRLREWQTWLRQIKRNPALCLAHTPVCGVWQCVFTVVNFEPAVQRISLEQQQPDRSWREIRGRHTIEFRAEAAKPKANIGQPFSAPLDSIDGALRVVCKGVGRVRIVDARCINGIDTRRALEKNFVIGKRAPKSGLPDVYATTGVRELIFRRPTDSFV